MKVGITIDSNKFSNIAVYSGEYWGQKVDIYKSIERIVHCALFSSSS